MLNSSWKFLDNPPPLAFAHRGVHLDAPENSWASFSAAAELGYKYVETDVRGTADGKVIMCHDARASQIAGLTSRVSALTLGQLRSAAVTGEGGDVPLLSDVLENFPGLNFNIDVKDKRAAELVPEIVRRAAAYDRVCITSFSARRIRTVRSRLVRAVCTGAPVTEILRFLAQPGHYAGVPQPAALQIPFSWKGIRLVTRKLLREANEAGLAVHVWTLNDIASIRAAIELGVDGIMTDAPVLLKRELTLRGRWH